MSFLERSSQYYYLPPPATSKWRVNEKREFQQVSNTIFDSIWNTAAICQAHLQQMQQSDIV